MAAKREKSWIETFSDSPENRRLYEGAQLIMEVTELISQAIDEGGLTRAQVAQRMGRSAAFVSQLLAGDRNMTLRSVADLGYACGVRLNVTMQALAGPPFVEAPVTYVRPARTRVSHDAVEVHDATSEVERLAA